MSTQYRVGKDIAGLTGLDVLTVPDVIYATSLVAATEQTLTVPGLTTMGVTQNSTKGNMLAVFTNVPVVTDIWLAVNQTAVLPTGSFSQTNTQLLNYMSSRIVSYGDVLHFISSLGGNFSVAFYTING